MQVQRRLFILIFLVMNGMSAQVWALPSHVEMWFLKEPKAGALIQWLNLQFALAVYTGPMTAAADDEKCIPMEGGCFHPQYGLMERATKDKASEKKMEIEETPLAGLQTRDEVSQEEDKAEDSPAAGKLKTINSDQAEKIDCDKEQFFDIYCGKAHRAAARSAVATKLEVWIDVSSSFKGIDYSADDQNCHRRKFVSMTQQWCGGKVIFSTYNTTIKEVMTDDAFCLNYGLNDTDRLIDWIKGNNSKNLIIITDTSEISTKLSVYLSSIGATTEGLDATDFFAKDLLSKESHIKSLCK